MLERGPLVARPMLEQGPRRAQAQRATRVRERAARPAAGGTGTGAGGTGTTGTTTAGAGDAGHTDTGAAAGGGAGTGTATGTGAAGGSTTSQQDGCHGGGDASHSVVNDIMALLQAMQSGNSSAVNTAMTALNNDVHNGGAAELANLGAGAEHFHHTIWH